MNNLYNVNFKTDLALYDKLRLITTIKKDKLQNVLTQLIENYVTENEQFIENSSIQEEIQPTLPTFYEKHDKWENYIRRSDINEMKKFAIRIAFHRHLLHLYIIDRDNDSELKQSLQDPKLFSESNDYKFLQTNGIITAVNGMGRVNDLPLIKLI